MLMADPHIFTVLIARRAEIAVQIEHAQIQLRQQAEALLRVPLFKQLLPLDDSAH
jgi:hypothetical protein